MWLKSPFHQRFNSLFWGKWVWATRYKLFTWLSHFPFCNNFQLAWTSHGNGHGCTENLEVASVQSNNDFTMPNPSQSYPDDLDLTEENFTMVCEECMKSIKITEDGINIVKEKIMWQSSNSELFKYWNGRLAASKFGEISKRRVTTPSDRLVRDLFWYKVRPCVPYESKVGLEMEPVIIS